MEGSEKHDHQAFLYHYAVIEEITLNYSVQIHLISPYSQCFNPLLLNFILLILIMQEREKTSDGVFVAGFLGQETE